MKIEITEVIEDIKQEIQTCKSMMLRYSDNEMKIENSASITAYRICLGLLEKAIKDTPTPTPSLDDLHAAIDAGGCPCCGCDEAGSINDKGYHETSDPEHLEPNEDWCDSCYYHFQETADCYSPSIEHYDSGQSDFISMYDSWHCKDADATRNRIMTLQEEANRE